MKCWNLPVTRQRRLFSLISLGEAALARLA